MSTIFLWSIAAATLAGIMFRPNGWPEALWSCSGAVLLVAFGFLSVPQAGHAIAKGTDVYLFLTGMMLLSELARRQGVFDWLASLAVSAAQRSRARLFALVYIVGVAVTVFLSNDATAVVLTPAVYAAVKKARAAPLPYLLICAFVANAASFVLPISNPANLVVYGSHLPPLIAWLGNFLAPSVISIVATYIALRWISRRDLIGEIETGGEPATLSAQGRFAARSIAATAAILLCASGFGLDLGLPTCLAALIAVLAVTMRDKAARHTLRDIVQGVSWSVLPLVAGLFVLVEALDRNGARHHLEAALLSLAAMPRFAGSLAASFGIAGLSNLMNNLPSGLLAGGALRSVSAPAHIRDAILIGIDLGPNLSVTGSLATLLWLITLRREGELIGAGQFLKAGMVVMPAALLLATLAVSMLSVS